MLYVIYHCPIQCLSALTAADNQQDMFFSQPQLLAGFCFIIINTGKYLLADRTTGYHKTLPIPEISERFFPLAEDLSSKGGKQARDSARQSILL